MAPVLALTETGVAAIVAATFSGIGAILGGVAALLSARGRRVARASHEQTLAIHEEISMPNGRSLADTVIRIEADLATHIRETEEAWGALGGDRATILRRLRRLLEEDAGR